MKIKLLSDKAIVPSRGSKYAAGYDLYSVESYELKVGERKAFKTDVSMAIPHGYYGRIAPRSGLALKKGIDVLGGVIDEDYRGELLVILVNLGQENVQINAGIRSHKSYLSFILLLQWKRSKGIWIKPIETPMVLVVVTSKLPKYAANNNTSIRRTLQ